MAITSLKDLFKLSLSTLLILLLILLNLVFGAYINYTQDYNDIFYAYRKQYVDLWNYEPVPYRDNYEGDSFLSQVDQLDYKKKISILPYTLTDDGVAIYVVYGDLSLLREGLGKESFAFTKGDNLTISDSISFAEKELPVSTTDRDYAPPFFQEANESCFVFLPHTEEKISTLLSDAQLWPEALMTSFLSNTFVASGEIEEEEILINWADQQGVRLNRIETQNDLQQTVNWMGRIRILSLLVCWIGIIVVYSYMMGKSHKAGKIHFSQGEGRKSLSIKLLLFNTLIFLLVGLLLYFILSQAWLIDLIGRKELVEAFLLLAFTWLLTNLVCLFNIWKGRE